VPHEQLGKRTEEAKKTNAEAKLTYTGEAQRQLVCIQVLDEICGQTDRHNGNLFFQTNPDNPIEVTGVQAIDNDMSFGAITDIDKKSHRQLQQLSVANLPYMDKAMAEHIKLISKEMLKFALADVLEDDEIEVLNERLEKVKKYISEVEEDKAKTGSRLLTKGEWTPEIGRKLKSKGRFGNNIADLT
jgi:hypothetical protein